jgi:hypothetical protein
MAADQNTTASKGYKRTSKGLDLLRRVLGTGLSRNRFATFSPADCLMILKALDEVVPRYQNKKAAYLSKEYPNLRK